MRNSASAAIVSTRSVERRDRWFHRSLALIGTLSLHAIVAQWFIVGSGAHVAWASDSAPDIEFPALLLVSPTAAEVPASRSPPRLESPRQAIRTMSPRLEPVPLPSIAMDADLRLAGEPPAARGDRAATLSLCRRIYRDEADLMRDVAHISLRGSVMSGGPITDADVDVSSGDRSQALFALRCLRAFGTLPPVAQLN